MRVAETPVRWSALPGVGRGQRLGSVLRDWGFRVPDPVRVGRLGVVGTPGQSEPCASVRGCGLRSV